MDIQLQCSANTIRRLQTDTEYREQLQEDLVLRYRGENSDFVPNIFVSQVPGAEEDGDGCNAANAPEIANATPAQEISGTLSEPISANDKEMWLDAPTKLLLSLYAKLRPKVGKTFDLKNKNKMWQHITKKLAEEGYAFSVTQVQGKYRTLEQRFEQTKLNNSQTGRGRQKSPYESELENILGNNRALQPEFLLDSDSPMTERDNSADGDGSIGVEANVASTSGLVSKRPKKETSQTKIFKKLDAIEKMKSEYQAHKIDFLSKLLKILEAKNETLNKIFEKLDK